MKLATRAACSSRVVSMEALRTRATCSSLSNPSTGALMEGGIISATPNMGSSSSSSKRGEKTTGASIIVPFSLVEGPIFFFGRKHKSLYLCQRWIFLTARVVVGSKLALSKLRRYSRSLLTPKCDDK